MSHLSSHTFHLFPFLLPNSTFFSSHPFPFSSSMITTSHPRISNHTFPSSFHLKPHQHILHTYLRRRNLHRLLIKLSLCRQRDRPSIRPILWCSIRRIRGHHPPRLCKSHNLHQHRVLGIHGSCEFHKHPYSEKGTGVDGFREVAVLEVAFDGVGVLGGHGF
ncbi:hypothetical protein BC829DRAFT_17057 [Chytridium lagenaria]|nr:hypothetical protein BC829DRAFT_17057 [Chytridium lagenaria]